MENRKTQRDFGDVCSIILKFLKATAEEIWSGVINNRVPVAATYLGLALGFFLYLRADVKVLSFIGTKYHIPGLLRTVLVYAFAFSGWIIWGMVRARQRSQLLAKLKDAFEAASLKCNGRLPSLIEDVGVDEFTRRLRLHCNGIPLSSFESNKERLEAVLNVIIVCFRQLAEDKSKVEIVYSLKDMPRSLVLENPDSFVDGEIPIGLSHEGAVHINLRDIGHMMLAGQTGGGKSNFLKVATSILTKNNPESNVIFLDLKGGMDNADLRDHAKNLGDNISCFDGTKSSAQELIRIGMGIEERFALLAKAGASTLDIYLKLKHGRKLKSTETERPADDRRTYVIADEIQQLYTNDGQIDKETRDKAKAVVNRIARQGRAAGIHLIAVTQKPDMQSFDQTVKANLPGVLCFPMVNQAASVSAIGTKRAFELDPKVKGRAIWKYGPKTLEVQTYRFNISDEGKKDGKDKEHTG